MDGMSEGIVKALFYDKLELEALNKENEALSIENKTEEELKNSKMDMQERIEDVEVRIKKREAELEGREYMPPLQTVPTPTNPEEKVTEITGDEDGETLPLDDNEYESLAKTLDHIHIEKFKWN
jgi:hypothetical protein